MAERAIDFNQGVLIHKEPSTGMKIYMYLGQPGHYLNYNGKAVPETLAKRAGFDTERFAKLRFKQEKMSELNASMEAELELAEANAEEVVVEERGGYKLVKKGLKGSVVDQDGDSMSEKPLPLAEAKALLNLLVPKEAKKAK